MRGAGFAALFARVEQVMLRLGAAAQAAAKAVSVSSLRESVNDPVAVAGAEARYYVRAGMDSGWADEADMMKHVSELLAGPSLMTPENRAKVAAAAMRGWMTRFDKVEAPETLAWYRQLDGTRIEVGRAQ